MASFESRLWRETGEAVGGVRRRELCTRRVRVRRVIHLAVSERERETNEVENGAQV